MTLAEFMPDTHPDVVAMLVERWREFSLSERVGAIETLHRQSEAFARAGVDARHPDASADENRLRVFALRVPRELMIRAYGWDPDERGR